MVTIKELNKEKDGKSLPEKSENKKNLKRIILSANKKCKDYAPTIQAFGLMLAILILLNNVYVLHTMKNSLDFEKNKYIQSQKQNWIFSIESDTKYNTKKAVLKSLSPEISIKNIMVDYPSYFNGLSVQGLFDLSDFSLSLNQLSFALEDFYIEKYNESLKNEDDLKIKELCKKDNKSTMLSWYSSELPLLVTFKYFKNGSLKEDVHIYMLSYTVTIERSCLKTKTTVDYHTFLLNNVIVSSLENKFQVDRIDKLLDSLWNKTKISGRDNGVLNGLGKILGK